MQTFVDSLVDEGLKYSISEKTTDLWLCEICNKMRIKVRKFNTLYSICKSCENFMFEVISKL